MKATPLTLRKKLALELWQRKESLLRQEHPLRQLFWECTLRCDLKCRHCRDRRDGSDEHFYKTKQKSEQSSGLF